MAGINLFSSFQFPNVRTSDWNERYHHTNTGNMEIFAYEWLPTHLWK